MKFLHQINKSSVQFIRKHSFQEYVIFSLPLLFGLFAYLIFITKALYGDEPWTYHWAVLGEPLSTTTGEPATIFSINVMLAKLGNLLTGKPWGVRIPSVLFAIGTIVVAGQLAKKCLGKEYIILTMWIVASSPLLIEFGGEARPYAISAFFGTAFLYCLFCFIKKESWKSAILLGLVASLGCLARNIFIANLIFAVTYYLLLKRRITRYALIAAALVVPSLLRLLMYSYLYGQTVQSAKVLAHPEGYGVSILNFLLRFGVALNFGTCTFNLPDLGPFRNVSFSVILLNNNIWTALIMLIAAIGISAGVINYTRESPETATFLIMSIVVPSLIVIILGQLGYSIVREKYLLGIFGGYWVLLAAVFKELTKKRVGRLVVWAFFAVVAISLYHYFVFPEIYSRRMMPDDLNAKIEHSISRNDCIISYHLPRRSLNYFPVLNDDILYIDLQTECPDKKSLKECALQIDSNCTGKIFLISYEKYRHTVDPEKDLFRTLSVKRDFEKHKFGRNLSLFIFSSKN